MQKFMHVYACVFLVY